MDQSDYDKIMAALDQAREHVEPSCVITTKEQAELFADWCEENGFKRPTFEPYSQQRT